MVDFLLPSPDTLSIRTARLCAGLSQDQAGAMIGMKRRVWQLHEYGAGKRKMPAVLWTAFLLATEQHPSYRVIREIGTKHKEFEMALTEKQIQERQFAVDQALANSRVEGYAPTQIDRDDFEAFAQGELTVEEFKDRSLLVALDEDAKRG